MPVSHIFVEGPLWNETANIKVFGVTEHQLIEEARQLGIGGLQIRDDKYTFYCLILSHTSKFVLDLMSRLGYKVVGFTTRDSDYCKWTLTRAIDQ